MPEPGRRVAVVTGAGRGIGLEICRRLARLDHTVILTARARASAEQAAAGLGENVHPLQLDVASPSGPAAVADAPNGRGLAIVNDLATTWDWLLNTNGGVTVRAQFRAPT